MSIFPWLFPDFAKNYNVLYFFRCDVELDPENESTCLAWVKFVDPAGTLLMATILRVCSTKKHQLRNVKSLVISLCTANAFIDRRSYDF